MGDKVNYVSNAVKIYCRSIFDALGVKCFVFVNLKTFLGNDRLKQLYEYIIYNKINVLLIENQISNKYPEENLLIIDSDLCEIY